MTKSKGSFVAMSCTTAFLKKNTKKSSQAGKQVKKKNIQKEYTGSVSSAEGARCSQHTAVFVLSPFVQRINTDENLRNTGVQRGGVVSL